MVKRLRGIRFNQERTVWQLDCLRAQLEVVTREEGVEVNEELHQDLKEIMSNHDTQITSSFSPNLFQKLFWSQQQKAATLPSRNVRWLPVMIKWCLYLKHLSSKAFETIQESCCIALPSQRTLRDYSYCIHSSSGFSEEVDVQLAHAAQVDREDEFQKCVCLVMDEMYVKENLVYNTNSGKRIGFCDLADINNHLLHFQNSLEGGRETVEQTLAKTMFVIMVRALFTRRQYPYVQFPCTTKMSGDMLYDLVWEAVYQLERLTLKVMAITTDGTSINRRFFKLHSAGITPEAIVYKAQNPHSQDGGDIFSFPMYPI